MLLSKVMLLCKDIVSLGTQSNYYCGFVFVVFGLFLYIIIIVPFIKHPLLGLTLCLVIYMHNLILPTSLQNMYDYPTLLIRKSGLREYKSLAKHC